MLLGGLSLYWQSVNVSLLSGSMVGKLKVRHKCLECAEKKLRIHMLFCFRMGKFKRKFDGDVWLYTKHTVAHVVGYSFAIRITGISIGILDNKLFAFKQLQKISRTVINMIPF